MESSYRQRLCLERRGATDGEVTDGEIRVHAVMHELVKQTYPNMRDSEVFEAFKNRVVKVIDDAVAFVNNSAVESAVAADQREAAVTAIEACVNATAAAATAAAEDRRLAADFADATTRDRVNAAHAAARMNAAAMKTRRVLRKTRRTMLNLVRRSRNQCAFDDFSSHGRNERLVPLIKVRAGAGVALPGLPGVRAHLIIPMLAVGDAVGAPFPARIRDFNALTQQQLSSLAIMLNEDFGITAGDSLDARRAKFQRFIVRF